MAVYGFGFINQLLIWNLTQCTDYGIRLVLIILKLKSIFLVSILKYEEQNSVCRETRASLHLYETPAVS